MDLLSLTLVLGMMPTDYWRSAVQVEEACLVRALYEEARGESTAGKIAVAHVVMNRARLGHLGDRTYCTVVMHKGQFTWNANWSSLESIPEKDKVKAYQIVYSIRKNKIPDNTGGALYFYNPKKSKGLWHRKLTHTVTIGNHIFSK